MELKFSITYMDGTTISFANAEEAILFVSLAKVNLPIIVKYRGTRIRTLRVED